MTEITWVFQQKLRNSLREHGAASAFCRRSGFSRTALTAWLNGTSWPTLETLEKIARSLGRSPAEMISEGPELPLSASAREIVALLPAADQAQATDDLLEVLRARLGLSGTPARQEKENRHRKR